MSADKRRTPPVGSSIPKHIQEQISGPVKWDEKTDPNLPTIEQINQRSHRQSLTNIAMIERLGSLEKGHVGLKSEIAEVKRDVKADIAEVRADMKVHSDALTEVNLVVARGDGKLDTLVEFANMDRQSREERSRAETAQSELEAARAHEVTKMRLSIKVALVGAILGGIAGIIAAFAWLAELVRR